MVHAVLLERRSFDEPTKYLDVKVVFGAALSNDALANTARAGQFARQRRLNEKIEAMRKGVVRRGAKGK
ncbi:hypothetical protein ASG19_12765 [Rhizobium sp. Leaf306]|nr:hypothetical protein ASG19_12765 [Rhizobium sp. Leaf306]